MTLNPISLDFLSFDKDIPKILGLEKTKAFTSILFARANPMTSADKSILPHDKFSRIIMICSVVFIAYWTSTPVSRACMAKKDEILEEKRYQNLLCAPAYKKEIQDLGNPRKNLNRVFSEVRRFSHFWVASIIFRV